MRKDWRESLIVLFRRKVSVFDHCSLVYSLLTLDVHAPLFFAESECFKSPLLTESFGLVNVLVPAIVSCPWVSF